MNQRNPRMTMMKNNYAEPLIARWCFHLLCATLVLTAGMGDESIAMPSFPQTDSQPGNSGNDAVDAKGSDDKPSPAIKAFRDILKSVADNEARINRLYASMPIGFPEEQEKQMSKIRELKHANTELASKRDQLAIKSFEDAPNQDPLATQWVFGLLSRKLDGSVTGTKFDPKTALEIATMMMKNDMDNPQVVYQAFRASYALQDFDRADEMLKRIKSAEVELNPEITEQLEDSKTKWQRELVLRSEEAAADDLPRVRIETTEGEFVVELFENQAPQTVANFISLVESGFYNDLDFHLVRTGQFAQTGCPEGNGKGTAGYTIPSESDRPDIRHHFAGTLSMATEEKDAGSSQIFISHQANRSYDNIYTSFGRVIEGLDVVYQMKVVDKTVVSPGLATPSKILSATVLRKRDHAYNPTRLAEVPNSSTNSEQLNSIDFDSEGPVISSGGDR